MSEAVITTELDFTNFNGQMARYHDEFGIGAGKVVKKRAGLLAWRIMDSLPPRSGMNAVKRAIARDTTGTFAAPWSRGPGNIKGSHQDGKLHWYQASANHLYGVEHSMNMGPMGVQRMKKLEREMRGGMGNRVTPFGIRNENNYGKKGSIANQHVYRVNRFLTDRASIKALNASKLGRVGRMKSGMLPAIEAFACKKPVPAWVRRHYGNRPGNAWDASDKKENPFVKFANWAFKITNQRDVVQKAVNAEVRIMKADLELFMRGVKKASGF